MKAGRAGADLADLEAGQQAFANQMASQSALLIPYSCAGRVQFLLLEQAGGK